jgi:uncharacterized membrane protein YdfJ with MMPL/SSD domain
VGGLAGQTSSVFLLAKIGQTTAILVCINNFTVGTLVSDWSAKAGHYKAVNTDLKTMAWRILHQYPAKE